MGLPPLTCLEENGTFLPFLGSGRRRPIRVDPNMCGERSLR